VKFISRAAWGARPARYRTAFTPSFGSTIHYEGPKMGSFPHASCAAKVRGIQAFHMDGRGWADIAYTAVVCPHGYVFEGRWIGARTGANGTNQGNNSAYALCALVGVGDPTPDVMVDAIAEVAEFMRGPGRAGRLVNGHRDWKPTACPGDPLYHEVRAGTFLSGAAPAPTPTPNPPNEERELMAVLDEVQEAITEAQNATIAYLAKVMADTEERLADRIDKAGAEGAAVRETKSGKVYVVTATGKTWVQPEELNLGVLLGNVQRWPGFPDRQRIPKVTADYLDDLDDDAELRARLDLLVEQLTELQQALTGDETSEPDSNE